MTEYYGLIFEVIVTVVIVLIAKYAIPYVKALTENEKYSALMDIVAVAVNAAEQTIRESGQGKVKKAQVIAFVSSWLSDKGIEVTEDTLDRLIEAAVRAMNQETKRE